MQKNIFKCQILHSIFNFILISIFNIFLIKYIKVKASYSNFSRIKYEAHNINV
jgi:hypothetical protein